LGHWFEISHAVEFELSNGARMVDSEQSGFQFVMQDPKESFSRETQTAIRRQAMRAVGARRRSGQSSTPSPTREPRRRIRWDSQSPTLWTPMPLSGLELLVKDRGIDPVDLSALTSIHIGAMLVGAEPRLV
jgi:hypothetical protein